MYVRMYVCMYVRMCVCVERYLLLLTQFLIIYSKFYFMSDNLIVMIMAQGLLQEGGEGLNHR